MRPSAESAISWRSLKHENQRKIYWNLCLVALLAMAVSALITALLLCQDLQTQMRQSVMTEVRYLESAMDVSGEEYLAHLKSRG